MNNQTTFIHPENQAIDPDTGHIVPHLPEDEFNALLKEAHNMTLEELTSPL